MINKSIRFKLLLIVLIFGFNVGCGNEETTVSLPEVACKPEDVQADPPFVIGNTRTAVPPETFLADQIENYYGVQLVENSLTNTTVYCDLFEMADEETAVEMLVRTCSAPNMEKAAPPSTPVGEEVCALETVGYRMVNFRQGRVVVSILADLDGFGVDEWAVAVNGRLATK
ncbi:MAG: hypothetical protein H6654_15155 [Ardenticatenaceae bacterium]|nr:hypothetical protein [Anaerolineales bacterium]MCB8939680.1 hypothetical protein [Ardenticatenaceae bacterium]MCB8974895.1 hypothetical protein [Ardenticatenaceae bacterium]